MATRKLTDSTAITAAEVVPADDLVMVLDKSDTTDAASGTNKKMTADELEIYMNKAGADLFLYFNFY